MNINIKYNDADNEFSTDLTLNMRLENYIKKHFPLAYTISLLAPIYLVGGSIRDLILARKPKDLDFVVLGQENMEWVLQVLKKFNINYTFNRFGGFKFVYQDTHIDLWLANDLFSSIEYNVDGLFFDLQKNSLFSLTFEDFVNNDLRLVNSENNIAINRERKLERFKEEYSKLK